LRCDEASILKSFTGVTTRKLIRDFRAYPLSSLAATATPAPNDHMELGQQSEFLGIMPSNEMLMRWFVSDQTEMGRYRLKHHAVEAFWDWMASWAGWARKPSDLGGDDAGFDLPPLVCPSPPNEGRTKRRRQSVRGMSRFPRPTCTGSSGRPPKRADRRRAGYERREPWVIWCDTDYEADAILSRSRMR
jgi:hypothetical protein